MRKPNYKGILVAASLALLPAPTRSQPAAAPLVPDAAPSTLAPPTGPVSLPVLVQNTCQNADFILAGDMNHKSNAIRAVVATKEFAEALKTCGVNKVYFEFPLMARGDIVRFQNGKSDAEALQGTFARISDNFHNMPRDEYKRKLALDVEFVKQMTEQKIEVIPFDNGQSGAAIMLYMNATEAGFYAAKKNLSDDDKKLFNLWMSGKDGEIPAAVCKPFEQRLTKAFEDPEVLRLFDVADRYVAEASDRTKDGPLVEALLKERKSDDKIFYLEGAGHFKSPDGMHALLAKSFRVTRIDLAPDAANNSYKPGDVRPDYVYRLDRGAVEAPKAAPPPLPDPPLVRCPAP